MGYGIFPINQRGLTTYSGSGYTVDRWGSSTYDTHTVELLANGLKVAYNGVTTPLYQYVTSPQALSGKTVTFSALYSYRVNAPRLSIVSYDGTEYETVDSVAMQSQSGLVSVTTTLRSSMQSIRCGFKMTTQNSYVTVTAVKLEIGDTQTLAREVNGEWVLNEIPNYSEELAKCQAYYIKTPLVSEYPCSLGSGGTNPRFFIPLPVTMAKTPTFSRIGADPFVFGVGSNAVIVGSSSSAIQISGGFSAALFPNGVRVTFQTTDAVGAAFLPCTIEVPTFELSAE